jgi:hypothetical protein
MLVIAVSAFAQQFLDEMELVDITDSQEIRGNIVRDPKQALLIIKSQIADLRFLSNNFINNLQQKEPGKWYIYLVPGTHRISFQAEGFISTQERFFFKAKEVRGIQINIIPNVRGRDRNQSIIVIRSEPDSAEVFIDQELYGSTPYLGKLIPGRYQIEIKKESYSTYRETVVLRQGETLPVNIKLNLEKPIVDLPVESPPTQEKTIQPPGREIPDSQAESPLTVSRGKSKTWLFVGGGAILVAGAATVLLLSKGTKENQDQFSILPEPPQYP